MSDRYDGPAIDMSWQTPPWMDDGETVDVVDDEENGTMKTENVPDRSEKAPLDKEWGPTEEQVAQARRLLLSGETTGKEIADDLPISRGGLSAYLSGERSVDPDNPPAITGNNLGEYKIKEDSSQEKTNGDAKKSTKETKFTEADVKEIKQRLLSGETTSEIAEEYGCHQRTIARYANDNFETMVAGEPIEYVKGEGWKRVENNEQAIKSEDGIKSKQTELSDAETTEEAEVQETATGTNNATAKRRSKGQANAQTLKLAAIIAGFIVLFWEIIRSRGNDE